MSRDTTTPATAPVPKRAAVATATGTRLGRVPADLHSRLCVIAWHERKTFAEVLTELAGELIKEKFAKLPKQTRDRIKDFERIKNLSETAEQTAGK